MPGQRDKKKRLVASWIPEELAAKLKQEAKRRGLPLSKVVEEYIERAIKEDWKLDESNQERG